MSSRVSSNFQLLHFDFELHDLWYCELIRAVSLQIYRLNIHNHPLQLHGAKWYPINANVPWLPVSGWCHSMEYLGKDFNGLQRLSACAACQLICVSAYCLLCFNYNFNFTCILPFIVPPPQLSFLIPCAVDQPDGEGRQMEESANITAKTNGDQPDHGQPPV